LRPSHGDAEKSEENTYSFLGLLLDVLRVSV